MENISTSIRKRRIKTISSQCKICGACALYSYFSVISCQPCRVFFRRNAQNGQKLLKCDCDNQCEININNRHLCSSCRLSKCLNLGMKVEMIRRSITNKKFNLISNQIEKFPVINLFEKDNLLFDNNQWILLSNIISNYEETKLLLMGQRLKIENNSFKSLIMLKEDLIGELMKCLYETTGISFRSNNDINHLSLNDRSILLPTAADNITCLSEVFIFYHSNFVYDQILWNYLETLYGKSTMEHQRRAVLLTQPNIIIFKLSLALFTFSSNARTLYKDIFIEYTNIKQILNIQNKYAELTWKYFIYKYGYQQAIKRFILVIQWLLSVCVFIEYAHNAQIHVNDIQSLIEQTELTLILDGIDKID